MLNKQELYELISKIGLFVFGVTLGLAAKLARMNKSERLTFREFVYHTTVAMAAAAAAGARGGTGADEGSHAAMVAFFLSAS